MPASIGVNLRVTGHCSQGGRKYMEDLFSVAYQQTEDERDLEYAFFGIYDGHGGSEAAAFAKEHLMDSIVKQRQFWSDNDEDVLKAIRNGYMLTHLNMWKELEKWPKTVTGLPSTAGTTASVAFIRRGKIYIGHVGDSAIVLGYQKDGCEEWAAKPLTLDHKPESTAEMERIQRCGGKVISKAGVPRVVWNRPRVGHKGPIKKNTPMDEIPFLAVARSLGDLWSYNTNNDEFIVSPDPDVGVLTIDPSKFRCLIFGTDGLWNMISPEGAVSLVQATERHNEAALVGGSGGQPRDWLNPSKSLVDHALERVKFVQPPEFLWEAQQVIKTTYPKFKVDRTRWSNTRMRADNTSVVTLMLDPPGPPRATVLRSRTNTQKPHTVPPTPTTAPPTPQEKPDVPSEDRHVPQNGLTIMTRYSDDRPNPSPDTPENKPLPPCATLDGRFSIGPQDDTPKELDESDGITNYGNPTESYFMARLLNRSRIVNTLSDVLEEIVTSNESPEVHEPSPPPMTSVSDDVEESKRRSLNEEPATPEKSEGTSRVEDEESVESSEDVGIQINEVSSSSPTECPTKMRGRKPKGDVKKDASGATCGRVLRSHDASPPPAPRPATRQAGKRPPAPHPPPQTTQPPMERVVILSRAKGLPVTPKETSVTRVTRSKDPPGTALAQKITRSISQVAKELRGASVSGNVSGRGPRGRPARPADCKENVARRRVAPPAAPPPRRSRRQDTRPDDEPHSTTGEACLRLEPPPPPRLRALRSRNDADEVVAGGKRARTQEDRPPAQKVPRISAPGSERTGRPLARRTNGPWAPALALRNRLRKRLAK